MGVASPKYALFIPHAVKLVLIVVSCGFVHSAPFLVIQPFTVVTLPQLSFSEITNRASSSTLQPEVTFLPSR